MYMCLKDHLDAQERKQDNSTIETPIDFEEEILDAEVQENKSITIKKLHLMLLAAKYLCPDPVREEKRLLIMVMMSIMMITNCRMSIMMNVSDMVNYKFVDELYDVLVKAMRFKLQEIATSVGAYMGTSACIPGSDKTPVGKCGRNLWRDNIIRFKNVNMKLKYALLEIVHTKRCGEVIDMGLMCNILQMLMDLGPFVYQQDFEKHFLDASTSFLPIPRAVSRVDRMF
uniref:Cullin-3A-like n=1 Tax=Tanacetum cinerariifolium TaxID=118510 RepID=A0A6L2MCV9_TANCI|nr:cullin-3A-like [Tanacetum cinerariifolium]